MSCRRRSQDEDLIINAGNGLDTTLGTNKARQGQARQIDDEISVKEAGS